MPFKLKSKELNIKAQGKNYKMFLTEQNDGYWLTTVLYVDSNSRVQVKTQIHTDKIGAYEQACKWVKENLDANAKIDSL